MLHSIQAILQFHAPTKQQLVSDMTSFTVVPAVLLVLLGAAYLLYGYRYFKLMVIMNAAVTGALLGAYIGLMTNSRNMPLLLGLAGAVLLGVLSWPLLRVMVGLMGAAAGFLIGHSFWVVLGSAFNSAALVNSSWAGGLIGMTAVGLLTFILFQPVVMVFSAVQGAFMLVAGLCSLLALTDVPIRAELNSDFLLIVLVAVPATIGFSLQYARGGKGKGGGAPKPKPAAKPA
jgi:hypothetical protein